VTDLRMVTLDAEPLTADAWAPFGWLPVADTDPSDGHETLHYDWADPHVNVIAHLPDEVEHTEQGLVCAGLYRHATHTQVLTPLNCDAVVAVAPPGHSFDEPDGLAAIRAFAVHPLDTFVLFRSTWHWGPFPLGGEPVRLLNVQGRGYADDNEYADLARLAGAVVEVRSP
jgi:ureidoglycolate hydrolase